MTNHAYCLPEKGLSSAAVLQHVREFRSADPTFGRGRMTAYCMMGSDDLQLVMKEAYSVYFFQNALVRRFMPGMRQMEEQVRTISAGLLSGGKPGVQVKLTSGGSESVFCGIHAAREWARERYPHIEEPELIAPYSVHATITKACHYLGVKLTRVAVGPDYRADVEAMAAAIGPNTIALAGSAPSWPYGKFDPIAKIAALGQKRNLWVHVDACVGGYIAPFVARLGYPLPAWDFSVPGVMSISADLHKYAYAPKPASTIAFASEDLLRYHDVPASDWPSATYLSEGVIGSRPAGAIAATWAAFHYLGDDGYLDYARRTMETKQRLIEGLRGLGMKPWDTELCILLFDTVDVSAEAVVGGLTEAGWPCMGTQRPPLVQLILDPLSADAVEEYLGDLEKLLGQLRCGRDISRGSLGYAD
ncbi:MAG TPA: aminotransferase class V-fold PLP-dependent enzyme [Steroidobacteraceae bacterium]|nr:aminotransferase class V-fold PLP-dependent enzyme [Steroidobacteraceae bacterium]